jgi:hypothetical protein
MQLEWTVVAWGTQLCAKPASTEGQQVNSAPKPLQPQNLCSMGVPQPCTGSAVEVVGQKHASAWALKLLPL